MPKASSTVSSWVQDSFLKNKISIKTVLNNAVSSIHLSFDLWISPNNMSLLAIVAYWSNEEGMLCHGLLGLRRLLGTHSGENQGSIVLSIIKDFQLEKSIGYFTLDNASNNVTALRFIQNHINILYQNIPEQVPDATLVNKYRYVQFFGHVLNLVVKVFLYGKKSVQLLSSEEKKNVEKENLDMERWWKVGSLGKLHNITVWIHGSPQRREAFCQSVNTILGNATQARTLILGNVTLWTGDYNGLERALKLRHAIDFHVHQIIREAPIGKPIAIEKDQLNSIDWVTLQQVFDFLKPFRDETLILEGHRT